MQNPPYSISTPLSFIYLASAIVGAIVGAILGAFDLPYAYVFGALCGIAPMPLAGYIQMASAQGMSKSNERPVLPPRPFPNVVRYTIGFLVSLGVSTILLLGIPMNLSWASGTMIGLITAIFLSIAYVLIVSSTSSD